MELRDAVREDPALSPAEKETVIRFGKRDDHATVYTAEAGLIRRLLAHTHVRVEGLTVPDEDARRDVPPADYDGGEIVGVRASIPVGALQVKLRPRKSTSHAQIVTDRVLETGADGDEASEGDEPVRADGGRVWYRHLPSTAEVAEEIGAGPDRLRAQLKTHPHASAGRIFTAFGADLRHSELLERWLERLKREEMRRARGGAE